MKNFNLDETINDISKFMADNKPGLLISFGVIGTGLAFVMGCKAAVKTKQELDILYEELDEEEEELTKPQLLWEETKVAAPIFAAPVLTLVLSQGCILAAFSEQNRRTTALATAYQLTQTALLEYKDKVVETIGENKERKVRDSIAKDRVHNNPPEENDIFTTGLGDTLVYDSVSGRYFRCDIDRIRKAEEILNKRLFNQEMYISVNEFYDEIGIPHIGVGDDIGWNTDTMVDIRFSSALTETDIPVLVLDYAAAPRWDFRNLL